MKLSNVLIGALLEFPIQKGIPAFEEIHFRKDKIFIFNTGENLKLDIESDIEFSIDAKDLKEVYSFVKTSPAVNFSLEENMLSISASNKPKAVFKYSVRVEDLPLLEELTEEVIDYEVDIIDKRSIIETASKFIGNDNIRPILSSVFVNKEYIAATNAHYCYLKNFGNVGKDFEKEGTLFPAKYIKFLFHASKISNAKDVIIIDVNIDGVVGKISYRNDDGKYPQVYGVMPDTTYSGKVSFNGKELLSDLKIFQKLNTETTIVTIKGNEITFRAENLDLAKEYQNTYKLFQNNGVDAVIGVSPKYLQTILQNTDCSMLTIKLLDATKAFLFNDVLLMPVMLNDEGHVYINGRPVKEIEREAIITMAKAIVDIDSNKYVEIMYDFNLFGRTIEKKLVIERKEVDGEITWDNSYLPNEEHLFVNLITGESKIYPAIITEDTPEVEAIKNQMMDGPDSTDDGNAEMEMAIAADESIEEQSKMNVLTNEPEVNEVDPDSEPHLSMCPVCGEYAVVQMPNKLLSCLQCGRNIELVFSKDRDNWYCPNCADTMEPNEETGDLECVQCGFICEAVDFDNANDPSGLLEASGLDQSTPEDDKMLQEINEKATPETVEKILEKPVSDEVKEARRKKLVVGGFLLKDGQFNMEDEIMRPESILDLSDELFEVEYSAMLKEKQDLYGRQQEKIKAKTEATKQSLENKDPRTACSKCGVYAWTKDIVDGLCPKCQKGQQLNSQYPTTKEESYEIENKGESKTISTTPKETNEGIQESSQTSEKNENPATTIKPNKEASGQIKMPWE